VRGSSWGTQVEECDRAIAESENKLDYRAENAIVANGG